MKYRLYRQLKQGVGSPLAFIHGLGSSGRYWRPVFEKLPIDVKASSYDLLGFGESPKPEPFSYSTEAQAKALYRTLRWHYPFRRVVLVGHSMGGLIALEFAKRYPNKIKALVLTNVPILLKPDHHKIVAHRYAEVSDRLRNELHTRGYRAMHQSKVVSKHLLPRYAKYKLDQPEFNKYDLEHISEYAYAQSIKHVIENQAVLARANTVAVPTLIICGKRDKVVIERNAQTLVSTMPHAKLLEVNASHQFPHHHPTDFVKILQDFTE